MDCRNPLIFYTTWYNIILYVLLISKVSRVFIKTYLTFAIPVFIIGEYLFWIKNLWKKCNFTIYTALINSIAGHWMPLFLYFYYNNTRGLSIPALILLALFTGMYAIYFNVNIPSIYGLDKHRTEYLHH